MTVRPSYPGGFQGHTPSPAPTIKRWCYVRGLRAERDVANQTCLRRRNHSHALELLRRRSTWMTIAWRATRARSHHAVARMEEARRARGRC